MYVLLIFFKKLKTLKKSQYENKIKNVTFYRNNIFNFIFSETFIMLTLSFKNYDFGFYFSF